MRTVALRLLNKDRDLNICVRRVSKRWRDDIIEDASMIECTALPTYTGSKSKG